MTFTALDTEQGSPSQPPEGAVAPPGCDAPAEATAPSEAHETVTEKSPGTDAPHAKAPAASLTSIAVKHKPAAPAKVGDLTRFFELAHRQPLAAAASEPPHPETVQASVIEAETAPVAEAPSPPSVDVPIAAEPEPALPEITPEPIPAEPSASAASEASLEVNFPLLLAPPLAAEDVAVAEPAVPAPTLLADAPVAEAAWSTTPTAAEHDFSSEEIEPLRVVFVPMEEASPRAEAQERRDQEPKVLPAPAAFVAELAPPPVELAHTADAAPPAPMAPIEATSVEPLPVPMPATPPVPAFKELADYWRSLRNGADHPAAEVIDRELVTERWPGTLLIAYTPPSHDPRGELRPGRVTRLGSACAETQNVADAGSQSTEWMLEVARTALVNDEPVEEQQRLSTLTGVAGFRMVALPLGAPKGLASAVLCTLLPCPSAPRFGKRRIWL